MHLKAKIRRSAVIVIVFWGFTPVISFGQSGPSANLQAPGYYRFRLGEFQITAFSDGTAPRHLDQLLSEPDVVNAEYESDHEREPIELSINAYLVNTGIHMILIDTGAGELFGTTSGNLLQNMKDSGVSPSQIDTILLTHIHADHSGGLVVRGKMQFPNATVYVSKRDVDAFVTVKDSSKNSADVERIIKQSRATVGPYISADKVTYIEGDHELLPGITSRSQFGHTPGHTAYLVESQGHKLLFWGDIVHSAEVQFAHPEVTIEYDINPAEAARQRLREFQFASETGVAVASDHISFPGLGHVRKSGAAYQWIPLPYSATVTEIDPR